MALISAAVAAVSTAFAVTTVATVSAAVVAVANVVAVVGLAVTAVGAVTGNKTLMDVGKIMGYVGMAGNIAGWGVGSLAEGASNFASRMGTLYTDAWNSGVGGMFSGSKSAAVGTATLQPASTSSPAGLGGSPAQGAVPAGATGTPASAASPAGMPSPLQSGAAAPAAAPAAPSAPTAAGVATPAAGTAPAVTTPATPAASGMSGILNNPMLPLVAGQGVAGAAGGWFQASATEEQVEMQKQIEERNRRQQELQNASNNFAPLINFSGPGGVFQQTRPV